MIWGAVPEILGILPRTVPTPNPPRVGKQEMTHVCPYPKGSGNLAEKMKVYLSLLKNKRHCETTGL